MFALIIFILVILWAAKIDPITKIAKQQARILELEERRGSVPDVIRNPWS